MTDALPDDVPIALAATVVVLRDETDGLEVLLMRRSSKLVFHGGAWVFPGGRVDPDDGAPGDDELETARRAGVRETLEEAGVALDAEQLVPISHWTTPRGLPRRFSTWFFGAVVATSVDVVVDGGEISTHRWMRPDDALAARARGEIELPPPTFVTLTTLQDVPSAGVFLDGLAGGAPPVFLPRMHRTDGGALSLYHGDAAYDSGDLDAPGPRHRLSMLESGWRYERSPELSQ